MSVDALMAETDVHAYATTVDQLEARFAGALAAAAAIDRQIAELAASIRRLDEALDPADLRTAAHAAGGPRLVQNLVIAMDHRGALEEFVCSRLREELVLTRRTQRPREVGLLGPVATGVHEWRTRLIALARLHDPTGRDGEPPATGTPTPLGD